MRRVLVADDDRSFRDLAQVTLEEGLPGAIVDCVADGQAALSSLEKRTVDVAVVGLVGGLLAVLLTTVGSSDDMKEAQEEVGQDADIATATEPNLPISAPPVAPPVVEPDDVTDPDEPFRVGGGVEPPQILSQVKPRYPEVAKAARVQGIVILEAIINKEGTVDDVRVLRGHPLLEQAAKDAIVKWKFKPRVLDGVAVERVASQIIEFNLEQE